MPYRTVGAGESILSIAKNEGFLWKTIWEDGNNADLRQRRKDPAVLFAGDRVFVPEKVGKEVSKPTDQTHTFKRKGDPVKLKIRLSRFNQPRANEKYVLQVADKTFEGTTDGDGTVMQMVPGNARTGTLILQGGKEQHTISIGELDPVDEIPGVQQRLNNLGYDCGSDDGELNEKTIEALKKFQDAHGLPVTGEIDGATKGKLKEIHR
jgi:N-acetylmuramoyl-L-alanine amidase